MKTDLTRIERLSRVVMSLLVGLLIWGAAVNEESFTVESSLPLNLTLPRQYAVLSSSQDNINVSYTGSGWDMLRFQMGGFPSSINREYSPASGTKFPAHVGISVAELTPEPMRAVSFANITPSQVNVYIDTIISRNIPVAPIFSDGIPGRFRFTTVDPPFVTVVGPASLLNSIDSVCTEVIPGNVSSIIASLASGEDMVAYSSDSVRVLIYDPVAPSLNSALERVAY